MYGFVVVRKDKKKTDRFPSSFMNQLINQDVTNLRCQFGTLSLDKGDVPGLELIEILAAAAGGKSLIPNH